MKRWRATLLLVLAGFILGRWSLVLADGIEGGIRLSTGMAQALGLSSGPVLHAAAATGGVPRSDSVALRDAGSPDTKLSVQAVNEAAAELYLTNPFVSFGRVQPGDNDNYRELPRASQLVLRSNTPWKLYARVDDDLVAAEDLTRVIPVGQLEFRVADGKYVPFAKGKRFLVASGGPTGRAPVSVDVDLRLRITWEDPPGSYQVRITYELETEDR
ncbi:MAG TPA: hypothetical protein GXX55_03955 [Firmicutes bacterium]|nr:hypothetical protein [Bacillota bacterium]